MSHGGGDRRQYHQHDQRWVKPQRAPRVEPQQARCVPSRSCSCSNNHVIRYPRDDEEHVDPDEASREKALVHVVSEDEDDGQRAQTVETVKSLSFHYQGVAVIPQRSAVISRW